MENSKKLLVIGDFAWDVLIRNNAELLPGGDVFGEVMLSPGGSAANAAVWASRCGLSTAFVGKIGRDRFGELATEDLNGEGVEAHLVATDEHRTASVAVWVNHSGQRSMVSGKGADFFLLPSELPLQVLKGISHLHLTAWSCFTNPPRAAILKAAKIARQNGATISFDPASFQMIDEMGRKRFWKLLHDLPIDIFFPNLDEGRALTGEKEPAAVARALSDILPTALIVLKLDARGALVLQGGVQEDFPPVAKTLIDATGAGDSFAGAFLSRYIAGRSVSESTSFAAAVAGWVINRIGARPPGDRELKNVLNR